MPPTLFFLCEKVFRCHAVSYSTSRKRPLYSDVIIIDYLFVTSMPLLSAWSSAILTLYSSYRSLSRYVTCIALSAPPISSIWRYLVFSSELLPDRRTPLKFNIDSQYSIQIHDYAMLICHRICATMPQRIHRRSLKSGRRTNLPYPVGATIF